MIRAEQPSGYGVATRRLRTLIVDGQAEQSVVQGSKIKNQTINA